MENRQVLNQALFLACTQESIDILQIEQLLKLSASPMSAIDEGNGEYNILYSSIISYFMDSYFMDHEMDFEILPRLTELFLDYGMDVNKPELPYDNDDHLHPLWLLAFNLGPFALETLRILLDHGLDADTAEICWGKAVDDLYVFQETLEEETALETLHDTIRKIMLCASYPHILNHSQPLQDMIWYQHNHYDLSLFRNWRQYDYLLDCSRCPKGFPEGYKTLVTIMEKEREIPVWKFGFSLNPQEI